MSVDTKLERARALIVQLRSLGKETEAMALEQMLSMTQKAHDLKKDENEQEAAAETQESPTRAARRKQLEEAHKTAATLRANGEIEKAEQIEKLLAQAPPLDEPSHTSQMIEQRRNASLTKQQDKVAHIEALLSQASSFTENPIEAPTQTGPVTLPEEGALERQSIDERREAARQLADQLRESGQVEQAERIEAMLQEVAAQAQPEVEAPVLCQQIDTTESDDPEKAARRAQIDSAHQLAAQLRRNGQIEKAEQIEALLAQAPDAADSPPRARAVQESKTEQIIRFKKEREAELHRGLEMIVLLHSKGRTKEADELVRVVTGLAEGMSEMDEAHALDGLEKLCIKIEQQTEMLGHYIGKVEDAIPESNADAAGWREVSEMCSFLDSFVLVLETQAALAHEWVGMMGSEEAKELYGIKLASTDEVIKTAQCISMQLEMLYTTIRVKEETARVAQEANAVEDTATADDVA